MDNEYLAPICLFVYKRLSETRQTVESLQENFLAGESELFIFSDGYKNENDIDKVNQVREYIKTISGLKKITIFESPTNNGLANSIIAGVTQIIERYGKVIVLEDDLILSVNFLVYMNHALNFYKREEKIFSISGYSDRVNVEKKYKYDIYFLERSHSWGWATWKNRWETIDWEIKDFAKFRASKQQQKAFNKYGSELSDMLKFAKEGKVNSWFIRFVYNQFRQNRLTVYPLLSKVYNNGFHNDATHCFVYNTNKITFDRTEKIHFIWPSIIFIDYKISKQAYYYKSLRFRFVRKILTILMRKGLIKQRIPKL
jgi:hypothetical protein